MDYRIQVKIAVGESDGAIKQFGCAISFIFQEQSCVIKSGLGRKDIEAKIRKLTENTLNINNYFLEIRTNLKSFEWSSDNISLAYDESLDDSDAREYARLQKYIFTMS